VTDPSGTQILPRRVLTRIFIDRKSIESRHPPIVVEAEFEDGSRVQQRTWAVEGSGPWRMEFMAVQPPGVFAKVWLETREPVQFVAQK
jgi:hypothetical protein